MSIYRGTGGAGDASSTVSLSQVAADSAAAQNAAAGALTSETAASTSAAAAAASQIAAAASELAASTSETNAGASATTASTSETNAATSASSAATSATGASTSAGAASTSAVSAAASATSASNDATTATSAATTASTAATNAGSSATNAAASALNAATSEINAALSYDSFDDRYLGAKAIGPTVDNDGDGLVIGAVYFDTGTNNMKVWTGSAWVDAFSGTLAYKRNLIINGDMQVWQRGTSKSGITATGYHTADRWSVDMLGCGTFTHQQDEYKAIGFPNVYRIDCTSALSLSAGAYHTFNHNIEAANLQHLRYGYADARPITISFWVRSNVAGTWTLEIYNEDSGLVAAKAYTTVGSGGWEKKSITFEGATAGLMNNDNGQGLGLKFWLGAGTNFSSGTFSNGTWGTASANRVHPSQVNLASSTANDWRITGIQMEVGRQATEFEHIPYVTALQQCQRYYWSQSIVHHGFITVDTNTWRGWYMKHPVSMRATPTLTEVGNGNRGGPFTNIYLGPNETTVLHSGLFGGVHYYAGALRWDAEL